jgi:hypothetical protein
MYLRGARSFRLCLPQVAPRADEELSNEKTDAGHALAGGLAVMPAASAVSNSPPLLLAPLLPPPEEDEMPARVKTPIIETDAELAKEVEQARQVYEAEEALAQTVTLVLDFHALAAPDFLMHTSQRLSDPAAHAPVGTCRSARATPSFACCA